MKVKAKREFRYGGDTIEKGEILELPDPVAESAIDKGYAEKAEEEGVPKLEAPEEPKKVERPDEIKRPGSGGADVEEFMKSGGGWLTADNVEEGDVIRIIGAGELDSKTFDRKYLNVPVEHDDAEYNLRLGKRNTKRIAKEYGTDTGNWVGKTIQVVSIEDYPQLDSKGLILKPAE